MTELLVIIAVASILIAVQLSALGSTNRRTLIARCATHLRQVNLAMQLYARDNGERLPKGTYVYAAPGNWPWDMPVFTAAAIEPYGATRNVLYCPANAGFNCDPVWNFGVTTTGGFRIIGYLTTLPDVRELPENLKNATLTPRSYSNGSTLLPAPLPSRRVLVADVTVSYSNRYDGISLGGLPQSTVERTSHLDGKYPLGGNMGMLDGHVEWREFSDMQVAFGIPTIHW